MSRENTFCGFEKKTYKSILNVPSAFKLDLIDNNPTPSQVRMYYILS